MKHHNKIINALTLPMLFLAASCGNSEQEVAMPDSSSSDAAEGTVTITVSLEGETDGTRSIANPISKGTLVDELIFAFYDAEGKRIDSFGSGDTELGKGQRKMDIGVDKPAKISLKVNQEKEYTIVCWAQYSGCDAYNTEDLTKVGISYADAKNNDDERDAFCGSVTFKNTNTVSLILHRPFAQINVGTTGADYRNLMKGEYIYPNMTITESQITIKKVATNLDVLKNIASGETDVTYKWNTIPAFINMGDNVTEDELWNGSNENEEFLKVNLNDKEKYKEFAPYKVTYPTVYEPEDNTQGTLYLTETFKYLSMCYVLPPASGVLTSVEINLEDGIKGKSLQTLVLSQVPVKNNWRTNILGGLQWMKDPNKDPEDPNDPDYPGVDPKDPKIPVIPPTNPEDPDNPGPTPPGTPNDPTSIFNVISIIVSVDNTYTEDKNIDPFKISTNTDQPTE